MISLSKYIKKYSFDKYEDHLLYSFESFCNDNNVDIDNDKIYEAALEFYEDSHWNMIDFGQIINYEDCQEVFYETLTKSALSDKLMDLLEKKFGNKISGLERYGRANNSKTDVFQVHFYSDYDFSEDEEFLALLNQSNYVLYTHKANEYVLKPNISKDVTKEVHKEKYLYHVTGKKHLEKILKFGLHPMPNSSEYITKLFFFMSKKSIDDFLFSLRSFGGMKKRMEIKYDREVRKIDPEIPIDYDRVVLKIDMSKINQKTKFFLDDNYSGEKAIYTFEPITPKAIVDHIDLDELRKNSEFLK